MRVPSTLASFARSVTLPSSGGTIFLYDAGSSGAPGLLLVHGLGDEADTWRRVIPALTERYHVVAPDLPGFGRSPLPPRGGLTPSLFIAVLAELVEYLGMRQITLMGSSLGATLGQALAVRHPETVSRLILVDGGLLQRARLNAGMLLGLLPGLGERRYKRLAGDLDAAYGSLRPYYANLDALPLAEREFLRERVAERVSSLSQMHAYFSIFRSFAGWLIIKGRFLSRRARVLPIPTLYVWGELDHIIPVETAQATFRSHPGAALAVIPEAGHLPHQETPWEFLRVIDQR